MYSNVVMMVSVETPFEVVMLSLLLLLLRVAYSSYSSLMICLLRFSCIIKSSPFLKGLKAQLFARAPFKRRKLTFLP